MRRIFFFSLFLINFHAAFSQSTPRQAAAVRTSLPVKIDGDLNEEAWKKAPLLTGFIEMRPTFGLAEDEKNKTEVYLLYDDNAIYMGGICHEPDRDSISTEFAGRDAVGVNDFIGILFDTYRDQINGLGFYVTPLGEQFDLKYSLGFEDGSWNSVYQTHTKIISGGWTFEMRIPYSAIRFSKEKVQNWGINLIRRRSKSGRQFSWNPIDPNKFGVMNQAGLWTNIENIKPPLRLSFSPYLSTYLTQNPGSEKNWESSVNGGMDLKYGISKGFTLDMALVPDFGQVQSDNQVLNLTPFEVRYNEYRSFFTEGTELFNKGNLFYSRRVGGQPLHYWNAYNQVGPNDTVIKNPAETKLVNATKVSGRTARGLGIGFFNAITKPQYATIENDIKEQYKFQTSPLTNYNVVVLDQALKNNSSLTLVNTNVWRSGSDYDANVTGALWDLYDNKVNWNIWGQVNHSRLVGYESPGKISSGNFYNLFAGKFRGRLNFELHRFYVDDKYNQRDMGYFTNNNYLDHGFMLWYKWVKPRNFYNNIFLNVRGTYSQLLIPRRFQYINLSASVNSQLKNLWNARLRMDITPEKNDFYEARTWGKMVKLPGSYMAGFAVNSNRAKKYSASLEFYPRVSPKYKSGGVDLFTGNNYRFSDKFSIGLSNFMAFSNRDLGFAFITANSDSVIVGLRNRRTVENIFNARCSFNNRMGLNFRLRHYWSKVDYNRFFHLNDDGSVEEISSASQNPDNNVNFFNIDMIYTWEFAPGSFINIAWKNAAEVSDQFVDNKYYHNLRNTLNTPQQNTFSIKLIYYLDYLSLRGKGRPG